MKKKLVIFLRRKENLIIVTIFQCVGNVKNINLILVTGDVRLDILKNMTKLKQMYFLMADKFII